MLSGVTGTSPVTTRSYAAILAIISNARKLACCVCTSPSSAVFLRPVTSVEKTREPAYAMASARCGH